MSTPLSPRSPSLPNGIPVSRLLVLTVLRSGAQNHGWSTKTVPECSSRTTGREERKQKNRQREVVWSLEEDTRATDDTAVFPSRSRYREKAGKGGNRLRERELTPVWVDRELRSTYYPCFPFLSGRWDEPDIRGERSQGVGWRDRPE